MSLSSQTISQKIKKVLAKYPQVLFSYLYGSYARNRTGPLSDIDIAFFFKRNLDKNRRDSIKTKIESELTDLVNREVNAIDLNDTNSLTPLLEKEIIYEGKLIFSKDEASRAHFESIAISEWLDWEPYQKFYDQSIIKELETNYA